MSKSKYLVPTELSYQKDSFMDCLDSFLHRIDVISETIIWQWSVLQFRGFPVGPHKLTLNRNQIKQSIECEGGCYPSHGAQFNFPFDVHKISDRYETC